MNIKKSKKQIGVGGLILSNHEKKLVNEVLDSNQLSYGNKTRRFENMFSKIHQVKYSLFMNSGTSALHLALTTLKYKYKWQNQDEILVPAVTFVATSNIVLHNNLIPIFVDVESHTYNIDPHKIEDLDNHCTLVAKERDDVDFDFRTLGGQKINNGKLSNMMSRKYHLKVNDIKMVLFPTWECKIKHNKKKLARIIQLDGIFGNPITVK